MKKEEIRKEYFKLHNKGHTNNQCRKILLAQFGYEVDIRTLRRWTKIFNETDWNFKDRSTRPNKIYYKITPEIKEKIISIKKSTGWGENKIINFVNIGHTSVNKILNKNGLTRPNPNRKKRIKYIRWQRNHPNSLWQMDTSDQKIDGKYCLSVIDDCSRYCLALLPLNELSTQAITKILDDIIKIHGKPREILTDNGSVFGLKSKHSKFDRWCNRRIIKHIRSAIHSPTITGKVERLFQTMKSEMPFCNKDPELFRKRYNHFRPHTSLKNKSPADIYFDFTKLF